MSDSVTLRAFLAVPSDGMWVESARGLQARLKDALPEASWTKPSSWHLTLKFFESISAEEARAFGAAIAPDAFAAVPGEIRTSGAVVFPSGGPARVLGIGFAPSSTLEEIARLAAQAEVHARTLGLSEERRPFRPHVTLARLRRAWPPEAVDSFRRELQDWTFPPWRARSCVLYQSRLEREGAVHVPLEEWSFTGGPRGVRA
ncbi:MAG TPA: RNA 2',3'-cyclic phosphodiesterase [Thermoanaerobaculia bacterium]|nr:RNA 2',3'-cyclic phosphodiesterase [Thermoanaerobaculia bacterium]